MTTIAIKSITECPNGTHKHVTVSVDGGKDEAWSFGPQEFQRAMAEIDPKLMFLIRLKMEWTERALGSVTLAKLQTLLVGKSFSY